MKIKRVYVKAGRYYYVQDLEERGNNGKPKKKWHRLTKVSEGEAMLMQALANFMQEPETTGNMVKLLNEFKRYHLPSLVPSSREEYERVYDAIGKAFIDFNVNEVLPGDILEYLSQYNDRLSQRRHIKARLSTFFSWCVLHDHCSVNPCREIKLKAPPKRKGKMTDAAYWAIRQYLPPIGQCFLDLCYLTAQRPTEIRLLRESQIANNRITFTPTKTEKSSGASVVFIITPEMQDVIDRARTLARVKSLPGSNAFLIQTSGGTAFTKTGLNSMWRRAREKAEYTEVTTKDIRPYALSTMEQAGYSPREIQNAAAHSDFSTTEHYLNQHRESVSNVRILLPKKPKT